MPSFKFHKAEHLKSRTIIRSLFHKGKSFSAYPLRLVWTTIDPPMSTFPVQFAQTVPKRSFNKANKRNTIRRRIREAFRLHKHLLAEQETLQGKQFAWMFIYVAKEELPYHKIEAATQKIIRKFIQEIRWSDQLISPSLRLHH